MAEVIAQTVNFFIVFLVLKKFAYQPIFHLLEARKAKIAEGIANAEKIKAQLAQTEVARQKKPWPRPANWRTGSSPRRARPPPA